MLPFPQKIAFALFALTALLFGAVAFFRLFRLIRSAPADPDRRTDRLLTRILHALGLTLSQSRTFRLRPWVSLFHSFIFYGFVAYLFVNFTDALEGYLPLSLPGPYLLLADLLSALVLIGVVALVVRRFLLPARRDFRFNPRTLLHPAVQLHKVTRDSLIVSAFILFHVGSRAVGAAAAVAQQGPGRWTPFADLLAHAIPPAHAQLFRELGYWGALGSVLLFLAYFPRSKHLHLFAAPIKYTVARREPTGVLPLLPLESDQPLGAATLADLAWPRLLDAYACVQCNRCQDVCPATATGKSLSPSALEINKRMQLNRAGRDDAPLLTAILTPEAAWACTTCGACIDVCPVGDEPMLDLLDIRRHQVLAAGDFPPQLQSAFRGMERAGNPWGLAREKRMDWAAGLDVPTTDHNPTPDVLFWVGCAAAFDPEAGRTARAFVQLLQHARVDFAVLGKRECCTGDPARRAGNEYLYQQLAAGNIATLSQVRPKLIVATCPHCLNSVGKEYAQLGGDYQVQHHTEYLAALVAQGRLTPRPTAAPLAFHDPCYLGRHNGVYDAPRALLHVLSNDPRELPRNRENSFCCGAGGAQFWKEEEPGDERISENRMREAVTTLAPSIGPSVDLTAVLAADEAPAPVLAVGCPFCKSMLSSSPNHELPVRDLAELLWEAVAPTQPATAQAPATLAVPAPAPAPAAPNLPSPTETAAQTTQPAEPPIPQASPVPRKTWNPKKVSAEPEPTPPEPVATSDPAPDPPPAQRKTWNPRRKPE